MGFMEFLGKAAKSAIKSATENVAKKCEDVYQENKDRRFGGKTCDEWLYSSIRVGILEDADFSPYANNVGCYIAFLSGTPVYVGRAVEYDNGGFRKRLNDYTRYSNSGRKHMSGRLMHEHSKELNIDIIITGDDHEAADIANKLEKLLIGKLKPKWNKQVNVL